MKRIFHIVLLGLFLLGACTDPNHITVYADPWLEPRVAGALEEYRYFQPGKTVEVHFRSSEVIAANIRHGKPMDLALVIDPSLAADLKIREEISKEVPVGDAGVVLAESKGPRISEERMKTQGCVLVAPTASPLRRLTEIWTGEPAYDPNRCVIIANTAGQLQHYLRQGWVRYGYTFDFWADAHPEAVRIVRRSRPVNGGISGWIPVSAYNPEGGKDFLSFYRDAYGK